MYDFRSLSSFEFQTLARDLIQAELGITLETFTSGPDRGIDARWVSGIATGGAPDLVVQCKHTPNARTSVVMASLRDDVVKVQRLEPRRYIVATSAPLSVSAKDKIVVLFAPYLRSPGDILGQHDLNNLLGKFPDVERRHYKLWLTSTSVLAKLLQSPAFVDSASALESIRQRLIRYVQNDSFHTAMRTLDATRCVVITGDPGIGKTTLAEALLVHHVDHGYEALRVTNRLSELKGLTDPAKHQIFYYDDFLGKTGLDPREHNENERLAELLRLVAATPNWRFILTTREYILTAAKDRYESLDHLPISLWRCAVELPVYTVPVRAHILFNHVYFSTISREHKLALLDGPWCNRIVHHRNYNPRVVEHMTDPLQLTGIPASRYAEEFLHNLENPQRVWSHAFRHHISPAARSLLLVLLASEHSASVQYLEYCFWKFHEARRAAYGSAIDSNDFTAALKELAGSFLTTEQRGHIVITFRNPSVRDFLEEHLMTHDRDAEDLLGWATLFDELQVLWRGRRGQTFPAVRRQSVQFCAKLVNAILDDWPTWDLDEDDWDEDATTGDDLLAALDYLEFCARVAKELREPTIMTLTVRLARRVTQLIRDERHSFETLDQALHLCERELIVDAESQSSLFLATRERILADPETMEDFTMALGLLETDERRMTKDHMEHIRLRMRFEDHHQHCIDSALEINNSVLAYEAVRQYDDLCNSFRLYDDDVDENRRILLAHADSLEEAEALRELQTPSLLRRTESALAWLHESIGFGELPSECNAAFAALRDGLQSEIATEMTTPEPQTDGGTRPKGPSSRSY